MAVITLNGNDYVPKKVRRYTVDPRGQQFRTTGEYQVSDNDKLTAAVFDGNWAESGIFWRKMRRRTGRGVGGMWKSTSETRFHEAAYNALLEEVQTHASPADHLRRYAPLAGDYFGLFESDFTANETMVSGTGKFGATSDDWTGFSVPKIIGSDESSTTAAGTTATLSYTVSSGSDKLIVLAYSVDAGASFASSVDWDVSGAENFTLQENTSIGSALQGVWYLDNPTAGAGTLTASGFANGNDRGIIVVELKNAASGAAADEQEDISTPFSVTHTAQVGDLLLGFGLSSNAAPTPTAPQIELQASAVGSAYASGSYKYSDGASPTTGAAMSGTAIWTSIAIRGTGAASGAGLAFTGRAFDMVPHKGRMFAVGSGGINGATELAYMVRSTTDCVTWQDADNASAVFPSATTNLTTTITRRNNFDDDAARLLDNGDTLWAFIYDYVNSEIDCYTSTNADAQGSETWVLQFSIPSADGPKGADVWVDRTGTKFPLLATAEAVYALDKTNNVFTREIPLDGRLENGRWMTVGDDDNLYIPLAEDDILQVRYETVNGKAKLVTERIGPMAAHDGMPSEWRGHANYVMSGNSIGGLASRWLWVAFGGHAAGKTPTILCYDYQASREQGFPVWHCFHDGQENAISGFGTSGQNVDLVMMGLSSEDDGTVRLHVATDDDAGTDSAGILFHFEEPLVNHEAAGVSGKYIEDTYIDFAADDHGDPHTLGAVHLGRIDAHELGTTSQEHIDWYREELDGTWGTTLVKQFADGDLSVTLGSGAGTSAIGSTHRLLLVRRNGTDTERAILHEFQVLYSKKTVNLKGYEIEIDLELSARQQAIAEGDSVGVETVIDRLEAIESLETLVALTVGGQDAIYVEMVGNAWELQSTQIQDVQGTGLVGRGTATILLEERV